MHPESLREGTKKRRDKSEKKLETRLSPGEKKNRKRMAVVATVFDLSPHYRVVNEIISLPNDKAKQEPREGYSLPPRPSNKRVWASIAKSQHEVIEGAFEEAASRDPWFEREWVYLVDGNREQLRSIERIAKEREVGVTIVMDFIHVAEYIWKAAWSFFSPKEQAVEQWVAQRLVKVLEGKASEVARGMAQSATKRKLTKNQRKGVDAARRYLLNNKKYLQYDAYLKKGYPIASGVIEGACRHLINDRLGITGARWSLKGAEAILRLRALASSGDLDEYWRYRKRRELIKNHLVHYANTELIELREAA
jgi:hypothetical protein